ncbi:rhodanese-like domain-containing protein [Virgibacillus sp. 179-BFC.A HS]|uniref:Rhodanese-like domain-containing protein n=1 Tax=Tigheibacillus jepli TaxID=3035914 RepID=A0ABU5CIC0_9BACI|nr:rhodanese-like domain-containing protein [Virgibacillus sp. 179-BFC.A HS]MDY0406108.1 rhodanese-like domain-containing protein [Virgibacillus sp. 179-BFC.A HS]
MKEITTTELAEKRKADKSIHIVDVREDEEVAQGKIPGAYHIPLGELADRQDELDKSTPYFIICRSGGRSTMACQFLNEQGFDVTNVSGGMLAWEDEVE